MDCCIGNYCFNGTLGFSDFFRFFGHTYVPVDLMQFCGIVFES